MGVKERESMISRNIVIILSLSFSFFLVNANYLVLFSHGIADTYKQAFNYAQSYIYNDIHYYNNQFVLPCPFSTFNYPDATECILRVNYKETSFGQTNEIKRLFFAYEQTKQWAYDKWNDCNIILFGLSRGASNLIIFAGNHNLKHVKAMILESPYYTMSEVIAYMLQKNNLGWI